MVDLQSQYAKIKQDIDAGIQEVIDSASFVKGQKVAEFQAHSTTIHTDRYIKVKAET